MAWPTTLEYKTFNSHDLKSMKIEFEKENLDDKKFAEVRDSNGISKLTLIQLILPCIRGSLEIP